jgi:hypothetical protein
MGLLNYEITTSTQGAIPSTPEAVTPVLSLPQEWSGFKQDFFGVDPWCCRCVHVTVIMERHPILICRFKLFPHHLPKT